MLLEEVPRHRLARFTVELVKAKKINGSDTLTPKRVREWAKAYRWAEKPEETDPAKIYCAATYYVFKSRQKREIAETFKVAESEVIQWIETHPEWYKALNICGFTPPKKPDLNEKLTSLTQKISKPSPKAKASDTILEPHSGFDGWKEPGIEHPSRQKLVKAT